MEVLNNRFQVAPSTLALCLEGGRQADPGNQVSHQHADIALKGLQA